MPAPQNADRPAPPPREAMTEAGLSDLHNLTAGLPLQFSDAELTMLWDTAPAITTWLDFKRFVYTASVKQLNPLLGDLHMEYRFDKASNAPKCSIVTHIEAVRKICARSGQMDGFEQIDGNDERGPYVDTVLWIKGCSHPVKARAYFREFCVTKQDGSATYMWSKMERHMTAKSSEKMARNIAFPEESAGMVIDEEMPLVTEQMRNSESPEATAPAFTIGEKLAPAPPTQPDPPPVPKPAAAPAQLDPATDPFAFHRKVYAGKLAAIFKDNKDLNMVTVERFLCGYFGVELKSQIPKDPGQALSALGALDNFISEVGLVELTQKPEEAGKCSAERKVA